MDKDGKTKIEVATILALCERVQALCLRHRSKQSMFLGMMIETALAVIDADKIDDAIVSMILAVDALCPDNEVASLPECKYVQ